MVAVVVETVPPEEKRALSGRMRPPSAAIAQSYGPEPTSMPNGVATVETVNCHV